MSFRCRVYLLLGQQLTAGFLYCFGLEAKPLHKFSANICMLPLTEP